MNRAPRWLRLAAILCAPIALTLACVDDPIEPIVPAVPAPVTLDLVLSADADVGAVLFTIAGPDSVTLATVSDAHDLFDRRLEDDVRRVALLAPTLSAGTILRVEISDSTAMDQYSVTLEQVSGTDNSRADPAEYSLALTRPAR